MPTLILENFPTEMLDQLTHRAASKSQSPEQEATNLLRQALQKEPDPRLPDYVPGEEISPPYDLPRPGIGVRVSARDGGARLPDPPILEEE